MAEAKQATGVSTMDPNIKTLRDTLMKGLEQMKLVMSKEMSPERMIRIAVNAASRNPTLAKCTPQSVGLALMNASQMELEPNGRDAHLVPYWNSSAGVYEAVFMPDYKGLIKLAYRSGEVGTFDAKAVYENDLFDFQYGTEQFLNHKPAIQNRGKLLCAWAMCKMKEGGETFVVMDRDSIEKRKAASQTGRKDKGPWHDWEEEMWAKTAVKQLSKLLPLGEKFEQAVDYDNVIETTATPSASVSLHLPAETPPGPAPQPGPDPGTENEGQGEGDQAVSKADQAAEQIRQNTQQRATTAKKPPADKSQPKAQTKAQPKPAAPAETQEPEQSLPSESDPVNTGDPNDPTPLAGETTPNWVERVKGILSLQTTIADLDFIEKSALDLGGPLVTGSALRAIERHTHDLKGVLAAKDAPPEQTGEPPTAEESEAEFQRLYGQMGKAATPEALKTIWDQPNITSRLKGDDLEMLEKYYNRRMEQLNK